MAQPGYTGTPLLLQPKLASYSLPKSASMPQLQTLIVLLLAHGKPSLKTATGLVTSHSNLSQIHSSFLLQGLDDVNQC